MDVDWEVLAVIGGDSWHQQVDGVGVEYEGGRGRDHGGVEPAFNVNYLQQSISKSINRITADICLVGLRQSGILVGQFRNRHSGVNLADSLIKNESFDPNLQGCLGDDGSFRSLPIYNHVRN